MKKTPSHFTGRVEIERQISFFSFGFARVSEVRHIVLFCFFVTGRAQFSIIGMIIFVKNMITKIHVQRYLKLHKFTYGFNE